MKITFMAEGIKENKVFDLPICPRILTEILDLEQDYCGDYFVDYVPYTIFDESDLSDWAIKVDSKLFLAFITLFSNTSLIEDKIQSYLAGSENIIELLGEIG